LNGLTSVGAANSDLLEWVHAFKGSGNSARGVRMDELAWSQGV
jgi:hypothetical protein